MEDGKRVSHLVWKLEIQLRFRRPRDTPFVLRISRANVSECIKQLELADSDALLRCSGFGDSRTPCDLPIEAEVEPVNRSFRADCRQRDWDKARGAALPQRPAILGKKMVGLRAAMIVVCPSLIPQRGSVLSHSCHASLRHISSNFWFRDHFAQRADDECIH